VGAATLNLSALPFRAIIRLAILRSKVDSLRNERHTWLDSTNERAA